MGGRVLIADGSVAARILLKATLSAARYRVVLADSAAAVLAALRGTPPDLVILGPDLGGGGAPALCRRLVEHCEYGPPPLLVLAERQDRAARIAALRAGADDVLSRPVAEPALLARLRALRRMREARDELRHRRLAAQSFGFAEGTAGFAGPGIVALVGASRAEGLGWKARMGRAAGGHRLLLMRPEQALALPAEGATPDLFVLSASVADPAEGPSLVSELRSRASTRHAGILVVNGAEGGNGAATIRALDLGADALMEEGFDPDELALRIARQIERKRDADRLRRAVDTGLRLAATDPLTGAYNRRYADHHLARIAARAEETGRGFAAMMLDLDHFKAVNDRHGHAGGDAVLCEVARRLRDNLRAPDLVARIGGEEFLVVIPECGPAEARAAGERLLGLLRSQPVALPSGRAQPITASLGLALGGPGGQQVEELLAAADRALYAAKAAGRDRLMMAPPAAAEGSAPPPARPRSEAPAPDRPARPAIGGGKG